MFVPHWADGDLLLGPDRHGSYTLADIKTVLRVDDPARIGWWLWQILAYAWLDAPDRWRIRTVGLYLARHGLLLLTLPDLEAALTSHPTAAQAAEASSPSQSGSSASRPPQLVPAAEPLLGRGTPRFPGKRAWAPGGPGMITSVSEQRPANRKHQPKPPSPRTLSGWAIGGWIAGLLLVAVVFTWLLLASFGSGSEQDKTQLDVVRTVINIAVSTGGAAALLLAVRKQRATEYDLWLKEQIAADDLEQKKQVAQAAEHDATERRITELYTKAVEQLGSDKAAVRLGGLYALERLAQDNEGHRQTIVNVLCAYLRMPHPTGESLQNRQVPAGAAAPATSGEEGEATRAVQDQQADHERIRQQAEERLVRQTVHRILTDHLRPERDKKTDQPTNPTFWENIELDLSGAVLEDWDFSDCEVRSVHFTRTHFHGRTGFERAVFRGRADFSRAVFRGRTDFSWAVFKGNAWFGKAVFRSVAGFGGRSSTTAPGSRGQSSAAPPCSRGRSSTTAPGLTRRPSTLVPGSTRCGFGWTLRLGACGRTGGGCGSPPVMRRAV